jgi:hypothetical protein
MRSWKKARLEMESLCCAVCDEPLKMTDKVVDPCIVCLLEEYEKGEKNGFEMGRLAGIEEERKRVREATKGGA